MTSAAIHSFGELIRPDLKARSVGRLFPASPRPGFWLVFKTAGSSELSVSWLQRTARLKPGWVRREKKNCTNGDSLRISGLGVRFTSCSSELGRLANCVHERSEALTLVTQCTRALHDKGNKQLCRMLKLMHTVEIWRHMMKTQKYDETS